MRAYLDHASTGPLREAVFDAMVPYLREHFADPGRVHTEGLTTRIAIENAREQVAAFLEARPREVVFTSGGTEAINAAVSGALARRADARHVVVSGVEHSAVREAVERHADEVTVVGVDRVGRVAVDSMLGAVRPDTALVALQHANHEVGTIQPVTELGAALRERDALFLVDACASIGNVPVGFRAIDADLLAVTAHKVGGPKGVGAMLVRRGLRVPPLLLGGAQERARRAGIENTPAIVGFAALCEAIDAEHEPGRARARIGRAAEAVRTIPNFDIYGDRTSTGSLPNLLCFSVGGVEAEPVLLSLDQRGIAAHSGSACASEALEPSPVLEAMGVDVQHALRVSVGWNSTEADIDHFVAVFPDVVKRLRALR